MDGAPTTPVGGIRSEGSTTMILATTTVEDVDRVLDVFGTKGAEKRALHGSKGSTVLGKPESAPLLGSNDA
jgi:hypothetical protein